MIPLSVFVIARNEEDRIVHTLESVRGWADEIIVIDSGSTDRTMEISERMGARVVYHAWEGYGPQKIFGETLCRNDWLLNLDADEAVSAELAHEIRQLFAAGSPPLQGYRLRIRMLFPYQKRLPRFGTGTVQTRLYHRAHGTFKNAYVHDTVAMKPGSRVGDLKGPVIHRCFRSHAHAVEKINFYSTMQAEDAFRRAKRPSALKLIAAPAAAFFKCYFIRGYIFYGVEGVVQSYIYAFARLLKLAKTREMFQEKK